MVPQLRFIESAGFATFIVMVAGECRVLGMRESMIGAIARTEAAALYSSGFVPASIKLWKDLYIS